MSLATLAGRRWGASVAGALAALPLVAGPVLLVIALEHGEAFGARAARGALLGVAALGVFCLVFVRVADTGARWPVALASGWAAFAVVAAALAGVDAPAGAGLAVALGTALVIVWVLGGKATDAPPSAPPPRWDLPLRAGATAAIVVAVTSAAGALGPGASGVLAPFPVALSVLAAFTLELGGPDDARRLLHGFARGAWVFALCFFGTAVALG